MLNFCEVSFSVHCFVDRCLSVCPFSFDHYIVCPSIVDHCLSFCSFSLGHSIACYASNYGCWILLWYLQTYQTWTRINIFSLIKFIPILLVHHECTRFSQTFFSYIWLMPNDFVCEIDTFIFHLVKAIHRIKTQIYNWVTMTTFWNNLIMSKHWQCK